MLNFNHTKRTEVIQVGFTNKLCAYRKKRKLTQAELAEKSGVSRATIAGIESGAIKNVKSDTLLKLSSALNVGVTKIFFTN